MVRPAGPVALGRRATSPAAIVVSGFAVAVLVGTLLLLLPVSRNGPAGAGVVDALFTATSAVCVTGLITVDTPVFWSGFGQAAVSYTHLTLPTKRIV